MYKKNMWQKMYEQKENEVKSIQKDNKELLRSNLRKDAISKEKDDLIAEQIKEIEKLQTLAKNLQQSGGSIVGKVTSVLGYK